MPTRTYEVELMRNGNFYRWFNGLFEGNEQVEDEPRSGSPNSAHKKEDIKKVQRLVM